LSNSKNYLKEQEVEWERQTTKVLHQMHAQTMWGFNSFELSKTQWKSTAVPKVTYSNAVTVISRKLSATLEKAQREAGKWALGISGYKVANEFVFGELGWSTFEAREAQSKIRYLGRIQSMPCDRWPKAILSMMDITHQKTKMYKRVEELTSKYECENITLTINEHGTPLLGEYYNKVKKRVKETMDKTWLHDMQLKSSLSVYRSGKTTRGTSSFIYDNSRGSSLLALARADMLPTKSHKMHSDADTICDRCGVYEETAKHIVFECNDIYFTEEDFQKHLGLIEEQGASPLVSRTKQLLETWEQEKRIR
jgi:hypothetical protein